MFYGLPFFSARSYKAGEQFSLNCMFLSTFENKLFFNQIKTTENCNWFMSSSPKETLQETEIGMKKVKVIN